MSYHKELTSATSPHIQFTKTLGRFIIEHVLVLKIQDMVKTGRGYFLHIYDTKGHTHETILV